MAYRIAVNRDIIGKLAHGSPPAAWARLNDGFANETLEIDAIADAIRGGHAIAPWHGGRRKRANFQLAQHVGIDFDEGDMTLIELARHPLIAQHAALLHTTASHRPEHPRLRVLFVLDRAIANPDKLVELVRAMLDVFGTADEHCSDASRLFFGAAGCEMIILGNVLSLDDAAALFVHPRRERLAQVAAAAADQQHPDNRQPVAAADANSDELRRHAELLLDMVRHAPNGEKHAALRDIARTFGGYVAGGYYARADAERWLRDAIESRRADVRDMGAAYDTIDEGLSYGEREPLTFTERAQRHGSIRLNGTGRPGHWFAAAPRASEWMTTGGAR